MCDKRVRAMEERGQGGVRGGSARAKNMTSRKGLAPVLSALLNPRWKLVVEVADSRSECGGMTRATSPEL